MKTRELNQNKTSKKELIVRIIDWALMITLLIVIIYAQLKGHYDADTVQIVQNCTDTMNLNSQTINFTLK